MPKENTMYDTDKLTNDELEHIGLDRRTLDQHNRAGKQQCTECSRYVGTDTITTKYTMRGIDAVKKGERLCNKCLNKRIADYNTLFTLIKEGKIKLEN